MSGIEIAGVLLATFPLIISGLEHWRDVVKVGGYLWRVREGYKKCLRDVQYYELVYKTNLKELLMPMVADTDEVKHLIEHPGSQEWRSLDMQNRLEGRLQESYSLYMEIISEMNIAAQELRRELSFDKTALQDKLSLPVTNQQKRPRTPQPSAIPSWIASAKLKLEYEAFRAKFSLRESVRDELFNRMKECNRRLEKLLSTSDKISILQNASRRPTKQNSTLEAVLRKARKKSDLFFKALHMAWGCSCQAYHFANLRLKHHTLSEICFEVILTFVAPPTQDGGLWSWRELQCGPGVDCSPPQKLVKSSNGPQPTSCVVNITTSLSPTPARRKKVTFTASTPIVPKIELQTIADPSVKLCKLLEDQDCGKCMGIIGHDDETYHLHPIRRWKRPNDDDCPLTLDCILSPDFEGQLSRRQRYSIALLLASSVAQLQFTPWLRTGLTKKDVLFLPCEEDDCSIPFGEPFIQQDFPLNPPSPLDAETNDCNFYSLGILLLELCFGRRLEDHPLRRKHPVGDEQSRQTFDLKAAWEWSNIVQEEGGDDYALAVGWCFREGSKVNQSWRGEIVENVIRPLELCQGHFKAAAV
ncbi:hypothetical protein EMPG_12518 [Blastomyces silverae]|uniref:DUF7580 domain-containing protein n=1 Tax=Blastomyces silverae TaxID=2060906 RepID=A0A0H1BTL1_9EURO|nr:hypothetical protein EMPG_12518 [Blastomyces silverae]